MSSVFVHIAAYNDVELYKTVKNCIDMSSGKNEIFFGIHECYLEEPTVIDLPNVRIKYSKAPENIGVGISRYLANKLYNGEDYFYQVDAHSRFVKNWDEILIANLEKHKSVGIKCILTCYPARYWYKDGVEVYDKNMNPSSFSFNKLDSIELFEKTRLLKQEYAENNQGGCAGFVSAANIFADGSLSEVEECPHILYKGDEALRAASIYTSGFNIVIPDQVCVYHLYGSDTNRVVVWDQFPEECAPKNEFADIVFKTILTQEKTGPRELGSARSLKTYGNFLGVDFSSGIIY